MFNRLILILVCILPTVGAYAAEPISSAGVIPLAVANRWEYSFRQIGVMSISEGERSSSTPTSSTGTCVEEIVGVKERRPNGDVVYEYRTTTETRKGTNSEPYESIMDSLLLRAKDGIFVLASKASGINGSLSDKWVSYNPPLVMYGSGLEAGTKWKVGAAREGKLRLPLYAQIVGRETVTVPAGMFEDCVKIHITCNSISGTMGEGEETADVREGKSITTIWVYPGVGVVKEDNIFQAKMEFAPDQQGRIVTMTGTQRKIKELQPGYHADSK